MTFTQSPLVLRSVLLFLFLSCVKDGGILSYHALGFQMPLHGMVSHGSLPSKHATPIGGKIMNERRTLLNAVKRSSEKRQKTDRKYPRRNETIHHRPNSRKLNSDIFRLRKRQSGLPLAEQRLEDAILDMIEEQNNDSGKDLAIILQQKQNEKPEDRDRKYDVALERFPDIVSFHAIMSSHAKSAHKDRLAPTRATRLLEKMKDLSSTFPHLTPTIYTYNAVMEAYSNRVAKNQGKPGNRIRSLKEQDVVVKLYQELQEASLVANTYTKNLVLASTPIESDLWGALERWAFEFLDGNFNESIVPDRKTYNTLFKIYATIGSVKKADETLEKLLHWNSQQNQNNSDLVSPADWPFKIWCHCILKALTVSSTEYDDYERRIQHILTVLADLDSTGHSNLSPDTTTYNHILNVYAKYGDVDAAMDLLETMEGSRTDSETPDCVSYTTVLKTLAGTQKLEARTENQVSIEVTEKATEVYERMRARAITPNILTYNTLISIWANAGTRDALYHAEDLFREIRSPDSVTYATLIHGWSKTRFPEAGSKAQRFFKDVIRLPSNLQRKNFSITKLCNAVISAYAKSGNSDAPDSVDSLLTLLEGKFFAGDKTARPDKITFLGIFDTYAKTGIADAEDRCENLLDRMTHYREFLDVEDLEPDRLVYNAILNALAKSQEPKVLSKVEDILAMMEGSSSKALRPDIVTYATVVDCYTKCGEMSLQRADELLRFVEGTFRSGDDTLTPNAVFYSAILQAWAKTGSQEGAEKAEALLERNIALYGQGNDYAKPHTIVFNAVMDAIARSNKVGAGARAEELLEEMESLYQSGDKDMRPSRRSFNAVILAYRNEGNASKKAEEILSRMEELADSGRGEVRPDVVSYNNVIAAVVEDRDSENTADRAQALLDQMEVCGIKPDGRTYSPVIEAWLRRNDEKGHALADVMLTQFLDKVEESKTQNIKARKESLYEDAVWNVINAYRESSDNDFYAQLASKGWISGG